MVLSESPGIPSCALFVDLLTPTQIREHEIKEKVYVLKIVQTNTLGNAGEVFTYLSLIIQI